ncbi:hypothetical protein GE061_001614 [Apolygus lucorum]|uniref:Uncharacterized protein n=1 Tax=Apolygus lucorum TaxID=248454 RepID=A0A8S9Y7L8_APOLU|nr:hypothetical protein GE061_001614 [Apolygus lucorum]
MAFARPIPRRRLPCKNIAHTETELVEKVKKGHTSTLILRSLAQETITLRYPSSDCMHIYTDGSAQEANKNAAAEAYCADFELFAPVGGRATSFDGEVKAVFQTLEKISHASPSQVVFFIDSQAAIFSIGSRQSSDHAGVVEARDRIDQLIEYGKRIYWKKGALRFDHAFVGDLEFVPIWLRIKCVDLSILLNLMKDKLDSKELPEVVKFNDPMTGN